MYAAAGPGALALIKEAVAVKSQEAPVAWMRVRPKKSEPLVKSFLGREPDADLKKLFFRLDEYDLLKVTVEGGERLKVRTEVGWLTFAGLMHYAAESGRGKPGANPPGAEKK